jgi:hypothetical protein
VRRALRLDSLRLSIFAAAGLGVAACGGDPASSTTTSSSGATSSTGATSTSSGSGGAGGASTTSTTSGTGGGTGGAADTVCAGATPILDPMGKPTGFSNCPDGTIHRAQAIDCDPTIDAPACTGTENTVTCQSDADCTAAPHGRCVSVTTIEDEGLKTNCGCYYSCVNDAECGAGKACVCAGVLPLETTWSFCATAACNDGAGCGSGECGLSWYYNGCQSDIELVCRNASDACRVEADCASDGGQHKSCVVSAGGPWQCLGWTCILGRPLLVEGEVRAARPVPRDDWSARLDVDRGARGAADRAALARYWIEAAALEHASVASFARFTLELLALGAPPALVAEAQRAGLDEVEHARVAYALASAYAGEALGPGPLDLGALRVATDRREVIRALVTEACVGETLGVAEALAHADHTLDPALARVHRRIAEDEQRHAELAWRTLAWLLEGADQDTRAFAARCFEDALAVASCDPPAGEATPSLPGARALGAARRQAIREVISPCAAALCA